MYIKYQYINKWLEKLWFLSSFNHLLQAIPSRFNIYIYQLINLIFFDFFLCIITTREQFPVVLCSPSEIEKMKFKKKTSQMHLKFSSKKYKHETTK